MDIHATVTRVRNEYKEYLRAQHPEWSESSIKTHASDAFYLWNNTIAVSFWKVFENDQTMSAAGDELYAYLRYEVLSNRADERASAYYKDLCMLKEFLESKGGVRACIGAEYDAEAVVYQYAKLVYDGKISSDEAVSAMYKEVPAFGETSHKLMVMLFPAMMEGTRYTRRANTETTAYFIAHMGADYGIDRMRNALYATQENVKYYYEQTGNKSNSIRRCCKKLAIENGIDISFGEDVFEGIIPKETTDSALVSDRSSVHYWIYSAGLNSSNWEQDYAEGIMAINWDEMGDLMQYSSKAEMRTKMQELYGGEGSYRNQILATWQFANEMKPGDIVFVKRGTGKIVGRGTVESDYIYAGSRKDYTNIRMVKWTDRGEWDHPGKAVQKVLTDITQYTDYVKRLMALFEDEIEEVESEIDEVEESFESYTADDFLQEVYMDEERYNILKTLLLTKKNIILQGAPGVGKTFAAKRLAFSIMGEKDTSRVKMVQFHQSYSYEDFIMGFRPTETGFELKTGVFYEFCRQAAEDDRPYFFIIDEINRGNLSKIFGELFMLIENDKRGVELQLLYADEQFSIPSNVHIIGMMNTADRSLAMLDYALRRRFAFFEIAPAFGSAGFRAYRTKVNNPKFDRLISAVEQLNEVIANDDSLGEGFCIGHSYFCTKTTINDEWLKSVVEFELVPLLKEYWFDEPAKMKDWSRTLREVVK